MKRFLWSAFKILVTLGLLYWVFSRYGFGNVAGQLLAAKPGFLAAAIVIFVLSNFLGAYQWQLLLREQGIFFTFRRAVSLYYIGLYFNLILPSSVGGDIVKVYSISRSERKGRQGLAATFVDRFAGFFLLALFSILSSAALVFSPILAGKEVINEILIYIAAVFTLFLALTALLFSRRVGRFIYEVLLAGFNPLGLRDKFREIHGYFHIYRQRHGMAVKVFLLSAATQLGRVAVHYYCARSIGFDIEFYYFLIFVPLIALAAVIPISLGGLGVRESLAPFLFTSVASIAAVDPHGVLAFATQFLASIVGILVGLAGGFLFVIQKQSASDQASRSG